MIRTDGRDNFITSLEIAGAKSDDIPMIPEVCIYFENQLFRGNRTHKFNAENFDAFKSVNYPALAVKHRSALAFQEVASLLILWLSG